MYWVSSSAFAYAQSSLTRRPWFLSRINPNYFYDYQKMFGERNKKDHDNYVERVLNSQDKRLKGRVFRANVLEELEYELKKFGAFKKAKQLRQRGRALQKSVKIK